MLVPTEMATKSYLQKRESRLDLRDALHGWRVDRCCSANAAERSFARAVARDRCCWCNLPVSGKCSVFISQLFSGSQAERTSCVFHSCSCKRRKERKQGKLYVLSLLYIQFFSGSPSRSFTSHYLRPTMKTFSKGKKSFAF